MKVKTFNLRIFLTSLILPAVVGIAGSIAVSSGMDMYDMLVKPSFNPPGWLFGLVWTVLYFLMGCSVYLIRTSGSYDVSSAMQPYYIQLALNFIWVMFFFRFGMLWSSVVILLFLIASIILTAINFSKINKTAAYLFIPYLLWCAFALFLNISVAVLN